MLGVVVCRVLLDLVGWLLRVVWCLQFDMCCWLFVVYCCVLWVVCCLLLFVVVCCLLMPGVCGVLCLLLVGCCLCALCVVVCRSLFAGG